MVGHKTEAIYRRYAIVAEADLVAGGEKLTSLHLVQGFTARSIIPFPESRLAHFWHNFGPEGPWSVLRVLNKCLI